MSTNNIDRYGHCCKCHRNLIVERVSDGKVIHMFTPDKEETEFLLDDGSRMRVCVCKQCKMTIDFNDEKTCDNIMEAVVNGWKVEVDTLVADEKRPEWDTERARSHMKVYGKKKILFHSENTENHVVEDVKKRIMEKLEKVGK